MELVIGTKVWSSWSMRPWLALKRTGAPFTETLVPLRQAASSQAVKAASPSGLVPVLKDGGLTVWDSLAICEYLAEKFPEAKLWPAGPAARAIARSATAEMHSGFASLRGECSMDLSIQKVVDLSEATQENIRRIVHLWTELRRDYGQGGPFLFGEWSIADAFYTPVATRFRSYGVRLSDYGDMGAAGRYAEALLERPEYLEWEKAALADRPAA
jgi:glutathione S-transferase